MRIVLALLVTSAGLSFADTPSIKLLAHRGVAQQFDREGLGPQTCTASRMLAPTHGYLENTLASIAEAFRLGADQVEIDIHPTTDGEFVVFHDWRLECRTEGSGVTRERPLAYLKSLDIGYGYTADGGATFPFRGKFVGAMPTWDEVMKAFPGRRFQVNIKSNSAGEGSAAVAYARTHGYGVDRISFVGGDRPMEAIRREWPGMRTLSRAQLKSCLLGHVFLGWSGHMPEACRDATIFVPINYTVWMWGWPQQFVERMAAVNSEVFVIGPYTSDPKAYGSTGIDSPAELEHIQGYTGGIVTDRIDVMGPALRAGSTKK
jgi:glycerophosphoryl diester phosphodiesterase